MCRVRLARYNGSWSGRGAVQVLLHPPPAPVQASPARRTVWNGSITATASRSSFVVAVLNPVNPSIATTSTASRHACVRSANQVENTAVERPSTMSSSREGPLPYRIGVRSMITVTYLSPASVCRQHARRPRSWSPPRTGCSPIRTRRPSAKTASFAVSHATSRPVPPARLSVAAPPALPGPPHLCPLHLLVSLRLSGFVLSPHLTATTAPLPAHLDRQLGLTPP